MASEQRHGVCKPWPLWPLRGRPRRLPRRQICGVSVPEADAEQLLERERGQRCALAKGLAILDKAPKVSDILQS